MRLEYVDLLFCHRPDPDTPIEETVRAMDVIVRKGLAFYWGTSEWSADQIQEAYALARELNCIPPTMEQPEYNLFNRTRMEQEYLPVFETYGMGTTIWSPLCSGVLTGKYNDGIPKGSRLDREEWLQRSVTEERVAKVRELQGVAQSLDCTMAQLAIAWCLKNPNVSTVITGASSTDQIRDNMGALAVKERLDGEVMATIDRIVGT